jgi:DNA invertase Pin-like site-specific DNA recombinase
MNLAEKHPLDDLPASIPESRLQRNSKIRPEHLAKLAIVYVRQSSRQQVLENRESTARQYGLAQEAQRLGWSAQRVLVIDEDQGQSGQSAENRPGFQRLLAEVTMEHVGLVLGLEMSRLARSSREWHHLFEICGIFGTLLADQEGVYDPNDPNDRLVLGLKGLMSEIELQTMRNRLERGRLNKAQRGKLFHGVSMGYVILPTGAVDFDPDEQAQAVVRLLFDKFDELGTIYGLFHWLIRHDVQLPFRLPTGAQKGQLQWRRPSIATLAQILKHPIYAGAYSYGRRAAHPKHKFAATNSYRPWLPMEQWQVLLKDHLPAYISWEQYLKNQERIQQNRNGPESPGAPRSGAALLSGVLVCGNCGRYMQTSYNSHGTAQYACNRHYVEATEPRCYGLAARVVDELVTQQVLQALQPAALELSLQAQHDIEWERQRLDKQWQQRQQRMRYDVELAERRYLAVDPANRLVAATLEKRWEEALNQEKEVQEQYDRFLQTTPPQLSDEEQKQIKALAVDIPALWQSPATTNIIRKQLIRCIVERVVVYVRCDSEFVQATIDWAGGYESQHEFIRPVATYAQLRDFEKLLDRVQQLRQAGETAAKIAAHLNAEGFYPPKRDGEFTAPVIYQLLKRRSLIGDERSHDELLDTNEWWLADLARELQLGYQKLGDWARRGWVHSRQTPIQGRWILWADSDEVIRLRQLLAQSRRGVNAYSNLLRTPKERPNSTALLIDQESDVG